MVFSKRLTQYLCYCLDTLKSNEGISSLIRYSSYVNFNREHPDKFNKYRQIFQKKGKLNPFYFFIDNVIAIFKIARSLSFIRLNKKPIKISKHVNINTIFISHLVHKDKNGPDNDFYFNHIVRAFPKNEVTLFIYLQHIKLGFSTLRKLNARNIIILKAKFSAIQILTITMRWLLVLLDTKILKKSSPYVRPVYFEAIKLHNVLESNRIELLLQQVEQIVTILKPKIICHTFEGHGFEIGLYKICEKHNIIIHFYQLSLLPHSNQLKHYNQFKNAKIFVTGQYQLQKLIQHNHLDTKNVILIGSNKGDEGQKRNNLISENKKDILFLPEGLVSEVDSFVLLINEIAKFNLDVTMILRLHPILNTKNFSRKIRKKIRNADCILSNNVITHDLQTVNNCVFRSSTSVFEALKYGVQPIYYGVEGKIALSPLDTYSAELPQIHHSLNNLKSILNQVKRTKWSSKNTKVAYLKKILRFYFEPLQKDKLRKYYNLNEQ